MLIHSILNFCLHTEIFTQIFIYLTAQYYFMLEHVVWVSSVSRAECGLTQGKGKLIPLPWGEPQWPQWDCSDLCHLTNGYRTEQRNRTKEPEPTSYYLVNLEPLHIALGTPPSCLLQRQCRSELTHLDCCSPTFGNGERFPFLIVVQQVFQK